MTLLTADGYSLRLSRPGPYYYLDGYGPDAERWIGKRLPWRLSRLSPEQAAADLSGVDLRAMLGGLRRYAEQRQLKPRPKSLACSFG